MESNIIEINENLSVTRQDNRIVELTIGSEHWPYHYTSLDYEECQKLIEILEQVKPFPEEKPF